VNALLIGYGLKIMRHFQKGTDGEYREPLLEAMHSEKSRRTGTNRSEFIRYALTASIIAPAQDRTAALRRIQNAALSGRRNPQKHQFKRVR
jgi:hypothetical protein